MGSRHDPTEQAQSVRGETRTLRLAVLLSGTGRTLENLLRVIADGELNARIGIVVSSVPGVRGIQVAESAGIPTAVVARSDFPGNEAFSEAVYAAIASFEPDLILLAGFLRKLVIPPELEG